jgi:hypothetical protein
MIIMQCEQALPIPRISAVIFVILQRILARRYLSARQPIPKSATNLMLCLHIYRTTPRFYDLFRVYARMYPATFDALCQAIKGHPVFTSAQAQWKPQIPVEEQLLIALQRFGTYGNAASLARIASWAGVGEGTVVLCTRRIVRAILDCDLRKSCVKWPGQNEREKHRQAVEDLTCPEWRNGWCMIDGTLVPLFEKPYFYGETFFDRKCNYSLNVQVLHHPFERPLSRTLSLLAKHR